jgi:hypothetical protein
MSLTDIARSSYATRREGATLRVRMFSRRVRVDVPSGVTEIVVETPALDSAGTVESIVCGGDSIGWLRPDASCNVSAPLTIRGGGLMEIGLVRADAVDPASVRSAAVRPEAFIRRVVTEARDRLMPLARATGAGTA